MQTPENYNEIKGLSIPIWLSKNIKNFAFLFASRRLSGKITFMSTLVSPNIPDVQGHFGPYGGRYAPETLMHPLQELEEEYFRAQKDPKFQEELQYYLRE